MYRYIKSAKSDSQASNYVRQAVKEKFNVEPTIATSDYLEYYMPLIYKKVHGVDVERAEGTDGIGLYFYYDDKKFLDFVEEFKSYISGLDFVRKCEYKNGQYYNQMRSRGVGVGDLRVYPQIEASSSLKSKYLRLIRPQELKQMGYNSLKDLWKDFEQKYPSYMDGIGSKNVYLPKASKRGDLLYDSGIDLVLDSNSDDENEFIAVYTTWMDSFNLESFEEDFLYSSY